MLIDFLNLEIIGHSPNPHTNTLLVIRASASIEGDLSRIQPLLTERGSGFENELIDQMVQMFNISCRTMHAGSD
ncbi:hypothetical protein [Priestia endophytica]|uniref:hypothetical protein n=1 Tax=Priestia endophytica TaxID=135735 RepID=UPI000F53399E|nr:hypothetical protein [Priestia endophytica]RPK15247.1 hypothetical protein FH5_00682 [Priestia endophytica]